MPITFHKKGCSYRTEDCFSSLNLLAHAQLIELDIGSQCGGHGICGGDRIRLRSTSNLSKPTEHELEILGEDLLAKGVRLACQAFPEQDDDSLEFELESE
jgi:ferredoxin